MTSISSLGSGSNAWSLAIQSQRAQQNAKLSEKLSADFDAEEELAQVLPGVDGELLAEDFADQRQARAHEDQMVTDVVDAEQDQQNHAEEVER